MVIEAPSGFAKTTALAAWAWEREQSTAWLTATHIHSSPAQLLSAVISSLLRLYPDNEGLGTELMRLHDREDPFHASIESIITSLPEDSQTAIVIDNAHNSSREALTQIIVPLARYSRGRLRFITASTQSVSTWLAKQLAEGTARTLPHTAFTFTRDEVAKLAEAAHLDRGLIHDAGRCLWEETRGWPVAVQLLLQSDYQGSLGIENPTAPNILTDYIETDVLGSLPEEVRSFLLTTTVSDGVSPSLVTYLTGDAHSPALLDECRRRGLFLEQMQDEDGSISLRWHSLFAQSCREIAKRLDADSFYENQRKAAEWLSTAHPAEALIHALKANDPGFAIRMIEDLWLQMILSGHTSSLETRSMEVPIGTRSVPSLLYIRACCRDIDGDSRGAQMLKARADHMMADLTGDDLDRARITRAFADVLLLDSPKELHQTLGEVEKLLETARLSQSLYIHGTFVVAWNHLKLRYSSPPAVDLFKTVAASAEKAGFTAIAQRASTTLASAQALAGQFTVAKESLGDLPETWGDSPPGADMFDRQIKYWPSAFLSFWQGDLNRAIRLYRKIDALDGPGLSEAGLSRLYFAFSAALAGDEALLDEASEMITKLSDSPEGGMPWPTYRRVAAACIHWARGDRKAAVNLLDSLEDHPWAVTTRVIAADLWRRLGYADEALRELKHIDHSRLVSYSWATMRGTLAAIAWERGNRENAHELYEQALDAAVPEGIVVPFVRLDKTTRQLMTSHAHWGTKHEKFLASRIAADAGSTRENSRIGSILSGREFEVYSFLRTSMTAEEIAKALYVSPATVRSHQASIYRKLRVTNRRDAVRAGTH